MIATTANQSGHWRLAASSIAYRNIGRCYLLSVLLQFSLNTQVQAQETSLGRLFSSPTERANLDKLRQQNKLGDNAPKEDLAIPPAEVPIAPPTPLLTHNGFVKRSNGTETTWINQVPNDRQKNPTNLKVKQELSKAPMVSILLPSGKRQELKVGQSFDRSTGKVREVYEVPVMVPTKDKAAGDKR